MNSTMIMLKNEKQLIQEEDFEDIVIESDDFLFDDRIFNQYLLYIAPSQKKTFQNYVTYLRNFKEWIHSNGITKPSRNVLIAYKIYLRQERYSTGTKNQYLRIAKSFFNFLYSERYIDRKMTENIKLFRDDSTTNKKEPFSEEQIKKIIESIDTSTPTGKRNKALILLLVTTGMRINEVRLIDISDIEIIDNQTRVYIQGKGHTSKDDYMKIIPEVKKSIDEYLETRPNRKKDEPLFTSTGNRTDNTTRISETSYSRLLKKIFKDNGFNSSKLTAHSLRHTANTTLLNTGKSLFEIQQFARHKSPETTERYLHQKNKKEDTSEREIFDEIFNKSIAKNKNELIQSIKMLNETELQQISQYINEMKGAK